MRPRKKETSARSIEDILKKVIKKLKTKESLSEEEIRKAWDEAAGDRAAKHTKPVSIRRSVLTINVDESGWLYELTIRRKELVKSLEEKFKGKKLKGIRFRIGEIK